MERQIEELKMYRELLEANRTLRDILPENRLDAILNTDNILAELQKATDQSVIQLGQVTDGTRAEDIKDEINTGGKDSITGDDLI